MQRARSIGLAALLLALVALAVVPAIPASAGNVVVVSVKPQAFNATVSAVIYNQTVNVTTNGTTIDLSQYYNMSQWKNASMVMTITGLNTSITVKALAGTTTVFNGQVTPLASGEYATVLPLADKIELSGAETSVTLTITVKADVAFYVHFVNTTAVATPGGKYIFPFTVEQRGGGPLYTVWQFDNGQTALKLNAHVYYIDSNHQPHLWTDESHPIKTTGDGWKANGQVEVTIPADAKTGDKYYLTISLYASPTGEFGLNAQLVAKVTLSSGDASNTSTGSSLGAKLHNVDAKSLGIGAFVALLFAFVFMGHGGRHGRRRGAATNPGVGILILLALIAAIALAAGVIDVQTRWNLDPKMLGLGFLALLALILLIRQGTVPAPKVIKKLVG